MLSCCHAAALPRCHAAALSCCRAAALPRQRQRAIEAAAISCDKQQSNLTQSSSKLRQNLSDQRSLRPEPLKTIVSDDLKLVEKTGIVFEEYANVGNAITQRLAQRRDQKQIQ